MKEYLFEKNDFVFYFRSLFREKGIKAFYQFLNRPYRRSYSRKIIKRFAPKGIGIEIGVGAQTIAPSTRTILSDGYYDHANKKSIAKEFFDGGKIPYPDGYFSFLLSEHVLEHITNPIKMLKEWIRVLGVNGKLILTLPHRDRNNDFRRNVTSLDHLISDYRNDVSYNDDKHYDEWIEKCSLPKHYNHLKSKQELLDTCSIHHHVWTEKEIIELLKYLNLEVTYSDSKIYDRRDSFMVVACKGKTVANTQNSSEIYDPMLRNSASK